MKRGNVNKRYYVIVMLIGLILLISACRGGGAATGTAPRTPFIGGTAGITINFEKDSPPPEVTDDNTFDFNVLVRLKNDGEDRVAEDQMKVNLVGFDPTDFNIPNFELLSNVETDGNTHLEPKTRGAEGDIQEGTTAFVTFPKGADTDTTKVFKASKLVGNTEYTFRADVCYNYETMSKTKTCMLRDMINVRDDSLCKPNGAKVVHASSAPVQVQNFKQNVVGPNKLTFTFDIVLSGNVDIFWSKDNPKPLTLFDQGCPRNPRERRPMENKVEVTITEIPFDPVVESFSCGGLTTQQATPTGTANGIVTLISGKRTIICTVNLKTTGRNDLEKDIGINLIYNVLDNKETKLLVKHFADETPPPAGP